MSQLIREIARVATSHRQQEGGGFIVRRAIPTQGVPLVDPFLLLDEMGPVDYAPGAAVGAPDHPHRGFETVTYVLAGEMEHKDSAGHRGAIGPGDVQWMTAGAGVVHSEMPSRRIQKEGGRIHGFQLWVNLPARDKLMAPRYQELARDRIPEAQSADGLARARVLAGQALGVSAAIETRTPIAYHDWTLRPGAIVETALTADFEGFVYVFEGELQAGSKATAVGDGQIGVFGPGDTLRLTCAADAKMPARALVIAGVPLREPVARYGPFVMNTQDEILMAVRDYQEGRMGAIDS